MSSNPRLTVFRRPRFCTASSEFLTTVSDEPWTQTDGFSLPLSLSFNCIQKSISPFLESSHSHRNSSWEKKCLWSTQRRLYRPNETLKILLDGRVTLTRFESDQNTKHKASLQYVPASSSSLHLLPQRGTRLDSLTTVNQKWQGQSCRQLRADGLLASLF